MNSQKGNILTIVIYIVIFLIAVATGLFWGLQPKPATENIKKENSAQKSDQSENIPTTQTELLSQEAVPVIIYGQHIKSTDPTEPGDWDIYAVIGDNEPHKLFGLKKVYHPGIEPIINGQYLVINRVDELLLFDMAHKKLTSLLKTNYSLNGFALSPDKQRILVWEVIQQKDQDGSSYNSYIIEIASGKTSVAGSGYLKIGSGLSPTIWRKDNIVVMSQYLGEGTRAWTYDLTSQRLSETSLSIMSIGLYGNSGKYFVGHDSWTENSCNAMTGSGPDFFKLLDIDSKKTQAKFGLKGKLVEILAFSPDDSEVLFSAHQANKISDNKENPFINCGNPVPYSYYLFDIGNNTTTQIDNPNEILAQWRANTINAVLKQKWDNSGRTSKVVGSNIMIGDKVVVTSPNSLAIFAQYYQ